MRDLLTVKEAAQACGVSDDTIKRRLRAGQFPSAVRGPASGRRPGPWLLTVEDLAAVGLKPMVLLNEPDRDDDVMDIDDPIALRVALSHYRAVAAMAAGHVVDLRAEIRRLHQLLDTCLGAIATHERTHNGDCLREEGS